MGLLMHRDGSSRLSNVTARDVFARGHVLAQYIVLGQPNQSQWYLDLGETSAAMNRSTGGMMRED